MVNNLKFMVIFSQIVKTIVHYDYLCSKIRFTILNQATILKHYGKNFLHRVALILDFDLMKQEKQSENDINFQ